MMAKVRKGNGRPGRECKAPPNRRKCLRTCPSHQKKGNRIILQKKTNAIIK